MGGCAAVNCNNSRKKKHRMFKFPTDPVRRRIWAVNCRRDAWVPGPSPQLCSARFEKSQFEQNRADNWKKLKQTAIPTLFDVPNPPPTIGSVRIKGIGKPKPGTLLQSRIPDKPQESENLLLQKIADLEAENKRLKEELNYKDKSLMFLSEEQKKLARVDKQSISSWLQEGIIQALKLRFALGKFGYNYLRDTGYPCPSYSTLNCRIQHIQVNFGVLQSFISIFKAKVDSMNENDKWCALMVGEMEISRNKDFDVGKKCFVGNVTLGNKATTGNHYTVVLLRGIKSPWKQVIAHEITAASTSDEEMKNLVSDAIKACCGIGLKIKATVSDMGSNNKALWKSFGVKVSRSDKSTFYILGKEDEKIHVMADVPHLIKNLRSSMLSRPFILPESICGREQLPTRIVSAGYIKQLWITEINADSCLRSLHHLNSSLQHLFPTHFSCVDVATAVQLFSVKTAAALEKAVHLRQISKDALTIAWWIRLVQQWFEIMTARHSKKGITIRNKDSKFEFLHNFIELVNNMQFGKGWKPLQTELILSTLSVINLATEAFAADYTYFLPGRLTQDTLENVFSQIRRKSGLKPTALQAQRALKLICISQFITDLKGTNYDNEFDSCLLDISNTIDIENQEPRMCSENNNVQTSPKPLTASEENDVYYIAGATLNGVLKQKLCTICRNSARTAVDNSLVQIPKHFFN